MFNLQIKEEDAAKRMEGIKFEFYLVEFFFTKLKIRYRRNAQHI